MNGAHIRPEIKTEKQRSVQSPGIAGMQKTNETAHCFKADGPICGKQKIKYHFIAKDCLKIQCSLFEIIVYVSVEKSAFHLHNF